MLCWAVSSVQWGVRGGGLKVEGKDGRVDTTRLNNLGGIEYGGGVVVVIFCH